VIPLKTQKRRNGYVETERKWAVGDKFFPAYKEARVYIVSRRAELLREALVDAIRKFNGNSTISVCEELADVLLTKFKIIRASREPAPDPTRRALFLAARRRAFLWDSPRVGKLARRSWPPITSSPGAFLW